MKIDYVPGGSLNAAPWRCTYVLKPDRKVLVESLRTYGWLGPIVVNSNDSTIIDGHERWRIAGDENDISERDKGLVPVLWVDCDEIDAMLMHVRVNRGRGQIQAKPLSDLLRRVLRSGAYDQPEIKKMLSMTKDESELLFDGGLVKTRKISTHNYSRAWVPVEAPAGAVAPAMSIERPPNSDR
jgi:ParB-like chromosome segregation protein Spo0J